MEDRVNWPKWSPYAKTYDPLQSGSIDGTDTTPHDRALIRAMEAKYVPPNKTVTTPDAEKTLFVGRLDHKTTEENLKHEFSQYGTMTQCRIVRDVVTGLSRGYAFVQFKHLDDAEKARRDAHRAVLDGREILVEWENGRTMPGWIPRRLGGGFGGKKESGQLRFGGRDRPFRKPIVIKPLRSTNLEEEDAQRAQEEDRSPKEEEELEKNSSRTEYSKDPRDGDGRFPRKDFSKPWDRSQPGSSRGGRSWRDRNEEDTRYSQEWDSYRGEKSRNYSNKRDWNERDDYYGRCSRDRREWEKGDRRYDKSSRDREEDRTSSVSSRDRKEWEDPREKERRKTASNYKSYWDRGNIKEVEEEQGRCGKMRDQEERGESRSGKKKSKSSRRSRDRDDSPQVRVKEEKLSPHYGHDMGEWEDTPERDERRLKSSPKDREDEGEESKHRKRSKRSRDRSDSEDDGYERKSKKKKKRSKKTSRDFGDSDESYEKRKEKKKKKHKKSRD